MEQTEIVNRPTLMQDNLTRGEAMRIAREYLSQGMHNVHVFPSPNFPRPKRRFMVLMFNNYMENA